MSCVAVIGDSRVRFAVPTVNQRGTPAQGNTGPDLTHVGRRSTIAAGLFETTRGTHRISREEALAGLADGRFPPERVPMRVGDVMIRDVRGLHRGTPNYIDEPRPMVVIGYSRSWYFRPEVHIDVPRAVLASLPPRAKRLLRYCPVVEQTARTFDENYRQFAY